jgi:asparagine synthase (glutamine-hydrolysing)
VTECSAFFLSEDEGRAAGVVGAAERLDRARDSVAMVSAGAGLAHAVALMTGTQVGLPLVHGQDPDVEGAAVIVEDGRVKVRRDVGGTRPVYVAGGSAATDHRLLQGGGWTMLGPGMSYDLSARSATARYRPAAGLPASRDDAASSLAGALGEAVKARVEGRAKVAVAFSGGLDSSLVAFLASERSEVVACSVFAPGSLDEGRTRSAADRLGLHLASRALNRGDALKELKAMTLPFEATPMDKALWCIYSVSARLAAEAGAEVILLGQLADELFGGYAKYERAALVGRGESERMMERDVADCASRGFVRDEMACARSLQPRFPYADPEVMALARAMPAEYKIDGGVRKAVLRRAAAKLGLPSALSELPKKAAQYSSGVLKLCG